MHPTQYETTKQQNLNKNVNQCIRSYSLRIAGVVEHVSNSCVNALWWACIPSLGHTAFKCHHNYSFCILAHPTAVSHGFYLLIIQLFLLFTPPYRASIFSEKVTPKAAVIVVFTHCCVTATMLDKTQPNIRTNTGRIRLVYPGWWMWSIKWDIKGLLIKVNSTPSSKFNVRGIIEVGCGPISHELLER